jgi:hypothetical protein
VFQFLGTAICRTWPAWLVGGWRYSCFFTGQPPLGISRLLRSLLMPETVSQTIPLGPLRLYACSILIGVVAACGAVVFRGLIAFLGSFHSYTTPMFIHRRAHGARSSFWFPFWVRPGSPFWSVISRPKQRDMACPR